MLPAYNEERLIGRALGSIPEFVDLAVVIDDASADGTSEAARRAGGARLRLERHAENRGVGAAIATGYRLARAEGADVIAVMAGDAQMNPADLPALLAPLLAGEADYAKGNRLRHPRAADMPRARRLGTRTLGWLTAHATGLAGLGDSQCGYTAISGSLVDRLPLERLYPRYGYPNDLLSLIAQARGRVAEIPVQPVYADERSGLRLWHVGVILGLVARAAGRRALDPLISPASRR